ncbi:MAG: YgeY family selenium metabolism-linked hydrolase, partial [Dethiobacteria bacterium]
MDLDFRRVLSAAENYNEEISGFLREMIAIPAESGREEQRVIRIRQEMENVGFDKVEIDPMGNVLGYMGRGKHLV